MKTMTTPQGMDPGRPCKIAAAPEGTASTRAAATTPASPPGAARWSSEAEATRCAWWLWWRWVWWRWVWGLAAAGAGAEGGGAGAAAAAAAAAAGAVAAVAAAPPPATLVLCSSPPPPPPPPSPSSAAALSASTSSTSTTASSAPPLGGSGHVSSISTATPTLGAATTTNGARQPQSGPRKPATTCPRASPAPRATWTAAVALARCLGGHRSPTREYSSGGTPPTARPVSVLTASSPP